MASRGSAQPQLTASWVTAVSKLKWRLLPIYKGPQPACGGKATDKKIIPAQAASQGTAAARDAIAKATALGIRPGSAFYNDIENYSRTDAACKAAVLSYLSAWTRELHRLGYLAGVYANLSSGALDLSATYASAAYARPDALWIARYDGSPALTGWAGVPNGQWAVHQRAKQYRAPGAAVATTKVWDKLTTGAYVTDHYVSTPSSTGYSAPLPRCGYPYQVTAASGVSTRTGPGTSYPAAATLPSGALAWVACQAPGSVVHTTKAWDKLVDGRWVTDYYVATRSKTTYTPPIPRC